MRRGHPLTAETRAKIAAARRLYLASTRALWQTPAYRTRTLAGIAAATAARRAREAARIELAYRRALAQQRAGA